MNSDQRPHRCPRCNALVVDRRSANCTTCREALPKEWVMTNAQAKKVMAMDAQARAFYVAEMRKLDPMSDPNVPRLVKFLDQDASGFI
jgi:ribosomal protein L37AE/L43A